MRKQNDLYKTILKLDSVWKNLTRDHNKIEKRNKTLTPAIELKQQQFVTDGKKTFHVVTISYEKYLEASGLMTEDDKARDKFEEDLQYLQNMHDLDGDAHYGAVASYDQALASTSTNNQPMTSTNTPTLIDTARNADQGTSSSINPDFSSDIDASDSASVPVSSDSSYEP